MKNLLWPITAAITAVTRTNTPEWLFMTFYSLKKWSLEFKITDSSFNWITVCLLFLDDVCASNPCQNGATCQLVVDGYICTCENGFLGAHCEIGKKTFFFAINLGLFLALISINFMRVVCEVKFQVLYYVIVTMWIEMKDCIIIMQILYRASVI